MRLRIGTLLSAIIIAGIVTAWTTMQSQAAPAAPSTARIVYLGDSITDGNTYPLIVQQSLADAKKPVPVWFNAGIGGNTAEMMLKRLDTDVFSHKPTIVTISAGINDCFQNVSVEDYKKYMTAIVDAVQKKGAEPILLTTTVVRDKSPKVQTTLDAYNAFIRDMASERKLKLVEVYKVMDAMPNAAETLLVGDGVHPNYKGQAVIARAVLSGLGYSNVQIPAKFKPEILPGVIHQWHMRAAKGNEQMNMAFARSLKAEECYATLNLPGAPVVDPTIWDEQARAEGFGMNLDKRIQPGDRFFGIATIKMNKSGPVRMMVGGTLKQVFINGQQVYTDPKPGFHAGREEKVINLQAGPTTVVIECGGNFFLSLTDPNGGRDVFSNAFTWPATVADTMNDGNGHDTGWLDTHKGFAAIAAKGQAKVVYIGDSLTDYWRSAGQATWNSQLAPLGAVNFGIQGDETQHVLWRMRYGELDGIKPKVGVLLIGTNNLNAHEDHTPELVAKGVELCVKEFQKKAPGVKVLVLGIPPRADQRATPQLLKRIADTNKLIEKLANDKDVFYMSLDGVFGNGSGSINPKLYSEDRVHFSSAGYVEYAKAVVPKIKQLLGE